MSEITIPYTPEHGAVDSFSGGANAGYNPDAETKETIKWVEQIYSKAKKYRKRYDQNWVDYYKMFRGRQWKEVRPSYRHSEVLNLTFETIESMVPTLTDSRPRVEYLPTIPSQIELADILTKVCANDWDHNNWDQVLTEAIFDGHFYGNGFGYLGFNPKAEMGLGCIEFETQDNFYVFPDPEARDINGKRTKNFTIAEPVDVALAKKEYKDHPDAKYITADVLDFQQADKSDIYQVMFKSPVDSKLLVEGPSGYDSPSKSQALKITVYCKDDTTEEEEKTEVDMNGNPALDEAGNEIKSYVTKLKYPTGRKVVVIGGVLLEDGPNKFEDGQYPYLRYVNYVLPREFWGMGEVEQLSSPQKTINKIISFTLDNMTLMGNPIWVVDDNSTIDTDNLFNKPGLVVEKAAGSEVRREMGVDLPSYILPFLSMYKKFFDGVSGQTDLSRGSAPNDVTAASAIEDLQEAQQTRLRLKSRNIDAFLQDFGKLYLSRVFQFYSVPRIVRVSGNQNADNYFYFHVEKLENGGQVAHVTDHQGQAKKIEIIGDFDVRVTTGSGLPFAKRAKAQMQMELFRMGVIDDEELLKSMDYPNYEKVLQRVQMKKQDQIGTHQDLAEKDAQAKIAETLSKADKTRVETEILANTPIPAVHTDV